MTEQPLRTPVEESAVIPDVWRNEVQARLERYKRRRGRRIEGAFTMRFPFPPEEAEAIAKEDSAPEIAGLAALEMDAAVSVTEQPSIQPIQPVLPKSAAEILQESQTLEAKAAGDTADLSSPPPVTLSAVAPEPEPEEEPVRLIELPPRPLPRRKVIAFPSPSYAEREVARRIADPVQPEQLRILDVPEELQAMQGTPFLEGLLDAPNAPAPRAQAEVTELPCATVRASKRTAAAAIDAVITLSGFVIFAAAAARFFSGIPATKFLIAGALAVSVLLWASYQYLCLVYGGKTLGMRVTGVHLQTFKGRLPDFRQRQLRVVALYLSVLSLGMGVLWSFVDADSLCWHDRISQTFLAAADNS
jgi:uncharacterized RDD family membrane protein YckC